jgi:hypothetical protein
MEDSQSKLAWYHSYYRVKKAIDLNSGREVAVKIMKLTSEDPLQRKEMLHSFY